MRTPPRVRLALVFAAGMVASPLAFWALKVGAQEGPRGQAGANSPAASREAGLNELLTLTHTAFGGIGGGGAAQTAPEEPLPRGVVHIVSPVSAKAAKTWEKLQTVVTVEFPNDTPLADFLSEVKRLSRGKDEKEKPISIYVDPVGLQEAEKTGASPVTISLEDVTIAKALTLALKQLSLCYQVQEDGLVFITADSGDSVVTDPSAKILDELSEIRAGLKALRNEVETLSRGPNRPR